MDHNKTLDVAYFDDRDILYLDIRRDRRFRVGTTRYHFMVHYDWDKPDEIVGFEVHDFSWFIPHLREPGVVPDLGERFDVPAHGLRNVTLPQVLEWAYHRFILREVEPRAVRYAPAVPAAVAVREEVAEYRNDA